MKDRVGEGKYDLWIAGGDTTDDPVSTMMPYYSTSKTEKGRYSNPKVDQLFEKLNSEFNEKKRLKIFKELAGIIDRDVADIPLFYEIRFTGTSEKVHGYGPPPGYSYGESGESFKRTWLK